MVPTPGGAAGYFGSAVALSKNTALVGEWDDGTGKNAGMVFIYTTDGMTWSNEAKIVAASSAAKDTFGFSVALDGDTALIGASGADAMGEDSGAAYIFLRNGGKWTQIQELLASDGAAGDVFGYSVAIRNDLATIGAYWDDDRGDFSGSVYTFSATNGDWSEQDKHAPADGVPGQKFGCSVSLDGDLAIAGAYGDNAKGTESGSAYIFSLGDTAP